MDLEYVPDKRCRNYVEKLPQRFSEVAVPCRIV